MFKEYQKKENEDCGRRLSFGNRKFANIRESFLALTCGGESSDIVLAIQEMAVQGKLGETRLRSLCWKFFLGVLPQDIAIIDQPSLLQRKRNEYIEMKEKYIPNATKIGHDVDIAHSNPLSIDEDNPWNNFYMAKELSEEIRQDLERLYPSGCGNHFEQPHLRSIMFNVLFVWSRMHSEISYRQGMHELAAILLYILESEQLIHDTNADDTVVGNLLDCRYLEHDLFWMFLNLMEDLKPLYFVEQPYDHSKKRSPSADSDSIAPFHVSCSNIKKLLCLVDPVLQEHLAGLEIEPQLFCLRWLRLIFQREFHIEDTVVIWDWVFAENFKFKRDQGGTHLLKAMEFISITMLEYMREYLLANDGAGCLHRLMHFPPIEDINSLLSKVQKLIDGKIPDISEDSVAATPIPQRFLKIEVIDAEKANRRWSPPSIFSVVPKKFDAPLLRPPTFSPSKASKVEDLEYLRSVNTELGAHLNRFARIIEKGFVSLKGDEADEMLPRTNEEICQAIAGVKQAADILLNRIKYEHCEWGIVGSKTSVSKNCDVTCPDLR